MGSSGCRSDGVQTLSQTSQVRVPGSGPTGVRVDALVTLWHEYRLPYAFPPLPLLSKLLKGKKRRNPGDSDRPGLAPSSLVRGSGQSARGCSVVSSTTQRPAIAGSAPFFAWCEEHVFPPIRFSLPRILAFLQKGLELGLALSSLKGQVSALSILFQKPLASRGPVKTFLQGVARMVPPYKAPVFPWDLDLVLSVLQRSPFEPIRDISLRFLSWKVVFLVAITSLRRVSELAALSCKAPFLIFHQDKVVLRPPPEFLPKVVSGFHMNEDIVLPSFCPAPSHPKERSLHCLDVVRALKAYLAVSASYRRSDRLFVIPDGPRKGLAASRATIARWIRLTIAEAYRVREKPPPAHVVAHSTRAVGSSWAMQHQASATQLCKAATWSSLHTFTKFYRVHTFASADASVGRKVLQAAVI